MTPAELERGLAHLERGWKAQGMPDQLSDPVLMARIAGLIRRAQADKDGAGVVPRARVRATKTGIQDVPVEQAS